jgi:Tol biopolymer transport system component
MTGSVMRSPRPWLGSTLALLVLLIGGCTSTRPVDQQAPIGATSRVRVAAIPSDAAIVFWSTRNSGKPLDRAHLYVTDIEGRTVTQLTFEPHGYEHVAISRDRRYIASTRHTSPLLRPGVSSVWVTDLVAGTDAQLVPEFHHSGGGGVGWSPDGYVFFAAQPVKGQGYNIFKIRPDGSGLKQLTHLVINPTSVPPDPAFLGDVSVSQDGSLVPYVRGVARKHGNDWAMKPQIWVMNADGTNQRMVHDGGPEVGRRGDSWIGAYDPEISPDNRQVVFSQTDTAHTNFPKLINQAHNIWVRNLDGSGLRIPHWQDGLILYTEYSEADGYTGIALIRPDGTGKKRLDGRMELWRGGRHARFIPPSRS